jgi:two-component system, sporulation sensor kinase E
VNSTFLDKFIERIDRIDPQSLQSYVLKLAREKGFLEMLFNTIQEGVIVTDGHGNINYLNAAACDLLGLDAQNSIGQPIARYLRDMDWTKLFGADDAEWRKIVLRELEVSYPKHRFLDFYVVPLADSSGLAPKPSGLVVILRDVTESRRAAESALQSEKLSAIMLLAAGVAHEIGNPLNSLNIHMQLMERELKRLPPKNQQPLREHLEVARQEIARLDGIVSQFLQAVRPRQPDFQPASLNELVRETLDFMRGEIQDRGILVETELAQNETRAHVDKQQIRQALFNVIKNAIQAMTQNGLLRVSTEFDDHFATVSVADNGCGIPREQIGRIFEPYFTTKTDGSGIGLMVVQRIISEHGGHIEIESDVGRGTTFRMRLPLRDRRIRLLEAAKQEVAS